MDLARGVKVTLSLFRASCNKSGVNLRLGLGMSRCTHHFTESFIWKIVAYHKIYRISYTTGSMKLSLKRLRFWRTDPINVSQSLIPEASPELHPPLLKRGYAEIKDPRLRAIVMSFDPYLGKGAHQLGDIVRTRNHRLAQVIEYDGKTRLIWISPSNEELTRGKQKELQDRLVFAAELAEHQRLVNMPWPALADQQFQQKVQSIFAQLGLVPAASQKVDPLACSRHEAVTLRYYQKIVSSYLVYGPYRGLLVSHGLGAGKTLSAIDVIDKFIRYGSLQEQVKGVVPMVGHRREVPHVFVVLPPKKSLDENFRTELATGPSRIRDQIQTARERHGKIDMANRIINQNMTIISYISLANRLRAGKMDLENSLMILDEAHNFLQPAKQFQKAYAYLQDKIKKTKQCKIVMLTATPIFRQVTDMPRLMNILKHESEPKFPEDEVTMLKTYYKDGVLNDKAFMNQISGLVSFYDISGDLSYFAKLQYLKPSISAVTQDHYKQVAGEQEERVQDLRHHRRQHPPASSSDQQQVQGSCHRPVQAELCGGQLSSSGQEIGQVHTQVPESVPRHQSTPHDDQVRNSSFTQNSEKRVAQTSVGFLESMGWVRMSNNKRDHGDNPPKTPVNPLGKELAALSSRLKRREIDEAQYGTMKRALIAQHVQKPYLGFVVCNSANQCTRDRIEPGSVQLRRQCGRTDRARVYRRRKLFGRCVVLQHHERFDIRTSFLIAALGSNHRPCQTILLTQTSTIR